MRNPIVFSDGAASPASIRSLVQFEFEIGAEPLGSSQSDAPSAGEEALQDGLSNAGLVGDGVNAFAGSGDGLLDGVGQR